MSKKPASRNRRHDDEVDNELIAAISEGRRDSFAKLVARHQKNLYHFGLRLCRDRPDAEDVVQDTFLNAFKSLKNFRRDGSFKSWLFKIAVNACLKKRRRSKFAPQQEIPLDEAVPGGDAGEAGDVPQWATQPAETLLRREMLDVLQDAILELPEKYRLVLVLRDIEGFSTAETAEILKISADNTKVRLHRARHFVRQKIGAYFERTHETGSST